MKLYFLKQKALDYLKANMSSLYTYYYREKDNKWIYNLFDYEPFELFTDIPDFTLTPISDKKGEVDLQNCKIVHSNLMHISESQASDERLWAGLCNGTFYDFIIQRFDYRNKKLKDPKNDASTIISRFFFGGGVRSGFFRNTLSKCWWVGRAAYRRSEKNNYELLDAIGAEDFNSKINEFFYNYTFSSNPVVISGLCKAWRLAREHSTKINVRYYLRPALQYINALGGSLLLDAFTEEEIKDIFFDYIIQLYNQETLPVVVFDDSDDSMQSEESEPVDESIQLLRESNTEDEDSSIAAAEKENSSIAIIIGQKSAEEKKDSDRILKMLGKPKKVDFGCTVKVYRESDDMTIRYDIPKSKENGWLTVYSIIINRVIGDIFSIAGRSYKIVDIDW